MSASDPNDPESQIVTTAPLILAEGQRSLAAIVFTDTSNFSALMSRDEERTRRLIARDLKNMRLACQGSGGQVVKSTGDGLLMLFTSAVQAVGCALEIQRNIREQNRALRSSERLWHRIGVHLGDVFRDHNDVMGDGVNIAARLQAEGRPGGVCVSSTVYEVVQNRLPFYVVRRGTRKLKNVGNVLVYQIAPSDARFRYVDRAWDWIRFGNKKWVKVAAIVGFILLGDHYCTPRKSSVPTGPQSDATDLNPFASGTESTTTWSINGKATGPAPAAGKAAATDEDFSVERFNDMKSYRFAAMTSWLAGHTSPDVNAEKLGHLTASMQQLFDWSQARLQSYSGANPLVVQGVGDNQGDEFWAAPSGGIAWKSSGGVMTLPKEQIPPMIMAAMCAQLIQESAASPSAPDSTYLWHDLQIFVKTYGIKLPAPLLKQVSKGAGDDSSDDDD